MILTGYATLAKPVGKIKNKAVHQEIDELLEKRRTSFSETVIQSSDDQPENCLQREEPYKPRKRKRWSV